jgi:fructose-1,6-bisphosphatase/inositol monophosphatase family enzyme
MTLTSREARAVSMAIEQVVRDHALRHYQNLRPQDIGRNKRGDLVTTADRAVEETLGNILTAMFPGTTALGEESTAECPHLISRLGSGTVWLIDPIDGTASFAAGRPRFCTLVALCDADRILASWTLAPVTGIMLTARTGNGASINGRHVGVPTARDGPVQVAVTNPAYRTRADREQIARLQAARLATIPCDSVGLEYIELCSAGRTQAGVFGWENPWDHAAGLLAHAEAGGAHSTASGDIFRLTGGNQLPLIIAPDRWMLDRLRAIIAA